MSGKKTKLSQRIDKINKVGSSFGGDDEGYLFELCQLLKDKQKKEFIDAQDYKEILDKYKDLIGEIDKDISDEEKNPDNVDQKTLQNQKKLRKMLAKDFKVFY